jgi:hypothetical protein
MHVFMGLVYQHQSFNLAVPSEWSGTTAVAVFDSKRVISSETIPLVTKKGHLSDP